MKHQTELDQQGRWLADENHSPVNSAIATQAQVKPAPDTNYFADNSFCVFSYSPPPNTYPASFLECPSLSWGGGGLLQGPL